ncbi:malto-oligosyltrehalose synthase [Kitasatospora sp. NBC_00039]|uniref:malto-oligosyltrehalose synthase n=1 Tax=Kitasatospora sp. NBC_00039 TaxID=2903565 RepID=UPI003255D4A6
MTSAAEPAQPRPAATPPPTPPSASYRLQLQPGFTLRDAAAGVPYLAALGVSHLHLSPLLEAAPGSTHGYDTVDHGRISEQLGGETALRALAAEAHRHGLRLIADVVPNHMAVPVPEQLNQPLWHVLRDGPDSPYARWFDIDWAAQPGPTDAPERGRVLLPLLGDRLGAVLSSGELTVDGTGAPAGGPGAVLRYHDHTLPLRPGTEDLPLAELLARQWYRLAWWRLARTELNYRRFFTVNELIAVRVEIPEVFEATHDVLLRLHRDGVLDGFRIDHPDGLADPRGYLRRLAEATGGAYTVVEKILTGDERLPADWPCAGTTGYDALRRIDGVLTDHAGAGRLAGRYEHFLGGAAPAGEPCADPHPAVAAARRGRADMTGPRGELAAEVERLVRLAVRIGAAEPAHADHAPWQLRDALQRVLTGYPAYRPYARPGEPVPAVSAEQLRAALDGSADPSDRLVAELALGRLGTGPEKDEFCVRFAQTAAAVAAKGVEDTAFYRWNALLSLNEVGGEPARPGLLPEDFHVWCHYVERHWPATMTVLSTHDTKRSADARARLAVLAEQPDAWAAEAAAWSTAAGPGGDRDGDWLLWQTLVAAWPITPDRLVTALLKAAREAKLRTSWTSPDSGYEQALTDRAHAVYGNPGLLPRIEGYVRTLAPYARSNTLAAALLHLTVPGVPDLYQGSEEPLHTLVDPDNRGVVDLGALAVRLTDSATPRPGDLAREKLHLTAAALHLRRARPLGAYRPLTAGGHSRDHLLAFARGDDVVTAVTRLPYGLERAGGWHDTAVELPAGGGWTDELTGRRFAAGTVPVADLLAASPVALLTRKTGKPGKTRKGDA